MEKLDEDVQIRELKRMCIFLAGCYQKNFDKFASCLVYSLEVQNKMSIEANENIKNVAHNFNTVQGGRVRDLVEEISMLDYDKSSLDVETVQEIFGYDVKEKRQEIYDKKFSEKYKTNIVRKLRDIWGV